MRKQVLFILATILSLNCYSQISFEKGYYIDNTNQKINCLVRNIDWINNPTEFEYRLSVNSEPKTATIKSVKEFGVYNISKYIRITLNIDRASENINNLSNVRNPIFKKEQLFLKVLVEGKSNLYEYVDGNLKRYFYNKENSNIEQLIFKIYKITERNIGENNSFRQQLWTDLKCPNLKMSKILSINYRKNDLVRFFTEYSNCHSNDIVNFEQKQDLFNLTIRPRLNSSSLTIHGSDFSNRDIDFENKIGFGLGLEAEFILPFNKNKWAILIEPTFQNFKSEKTTNVGSILGSKMITKVDYNSIEVPVSLRYYFFLNKNSKIFVNTSYIFDLSLKSSIEYTRVDGSNLSSLDSDTQNNLAFGIGYKKNDRYSLEIRYQTNREILSSYKYRNSDYKTLSIIFGYSLF